MTLQEHLDSLLKVLAQIVLWFLPHGDPDDAIAGAVVLRYLLAGKK